MIAEIIKGVAEKLKTNFPDVTIYTESVPQNLQTPAFFVYTFEGTRVYRYLGKRWKAEIKIGVAYYTENRDVNDEINGVLDKLFLCLEYIAADGITRRSTNAKVNDAEGYIYFTTEYDFFFIVTDEDEFMQELNMEVNAYGRTETEKEAGSNSEIHKGGGDTQQDV